MTGAINYLKLANYRSLDVLELHDIQPFSVFAGPNGSGKSNFFDALEFVSLVTRFDGEEALKQHGGFENIQCINRHGEEATLFKFEIRSTLLEVGVDIEWLPPHDVFLLFLNSLIRKKTPRTF
jgi:predicted ATPase